MKNKRNLMELSVENLQKSPPMERKKRREARPQLKQRPRPSIWGKNWRILFIEDGGAIVSFENARLIVAGIILIILILFGLCSGFFWMYVNAESHRRDFSQRTAGLERELSEIRDEKDRIVARMVLSKAASGESGDAAENKDADDQSPSPLKRAEREKTVAAEALPNLIFPERVAVKEFVASQVEAEKALDIRFKLINVGPDRISGYLFAVLKPDSEHSETWRAVPEVELKAGRPAAHENGQQFSISRYKMMRFRVKDADSYAMVTLWIFAEDGSLLLKYDESFAK